MSAITQVRIKLHEDDKLKAFASITLDCAWVIHGLKVIQGTSGLFVAMPARKDRDGFFKDIVHPLDNATRQHVTQLILAKYCSLVYPDGAPEGWAK